MNKIILIILLSIPSLALQAQKVEIRTLMNDALNAIVEKKYDTAKILYQTVLSLNPSKVQEEFARKKIEAINTELGKGVAKVEPKSLTVTQEIHKKEILTSASVISSQSRFSNRDKEEERGINLPSSPEVVMDSALTAYSRNDFKKARDLFNTILTIKSSQQQQQYAREKIESIDATLGKTVTVTQPNNPVVKVAKPEELDARKVAGEIDTVSKSKKINPTANKQMANAGAATPSLNKTASTTDTTSFVKNAVDRGKLTVNVLSIDTVAKSVAALQQANNSPTTENYKSENSEENLALAQKVLSEQPSLNLIDSTNNMRLICQNILADGKHTFIKFLIQNNTSEDFNIGSTELLYVKNYGILKKLKGGYFQDPTTIKSKNQSQLVYIVEDPGLIESNEVFMFEMEDLAKKTRLSININANAFLGKK
jgi:tetratricopeptide (TPR) repeat protein